MSNMAATNKYIGGFFITEAVVSMLFSEDKRAISQIGRFARVAIGYYVYKNPVLK